MCLRSWSRRGLRLEKEELDTSDGRRRTRGRGVNRAPLPEVRLSNSSSPHTCVDSSLCEGDYEKVFFLTN